MENVSGYPNWMDGRADVYYGTWTTKAAWLTGIQIVCANINVCKRVS